jgi:hypothetical protein
VLDAGSPRAQLRLGTALGRERGDHGHGRAVWVNCELEDTASLGCKDQTPCRSVPLRLKQELKIFNWTLFCHTFVRCWLASHCTLNHILQYWFSELTDSIPAAIEAWFVSRLVSKLWNLMRVNCRCSPQDSMYSKMDWKEKWVMMSIWIQVQGQCIGWYSKDHDARQSITLSWVVVKQEICYFCSRLWMSTEIAGATEYLKELSAYLTVQVIVFIVK